LIKIIIENILYILLYGGIEKKNPFSEREKNILKDKDQN